MAEEPKPPNVIETIGEALEAIGEAVERGGHKMYREIHEARRRGPKPATPPALPPKAGESIVVSDAPAEWVAFVISTQDRRPIEGLAISVVAVNEKDARDLVCAVLHGAFTVRVVKQEALRRKKRGAKADVGCTVCKRPPGKPCPACGR